MIIMLRPKKILKAAAFFTLLVICVLPLSDERIMAAYAGYSMRKLPVYSVETDKKMVCLTFDAAWGADKTQKIIDLISGNEIKATFFLTGFWIDKYEEEVKMLNAAGIETENHSENHPDMTKLSKERMRSELLSVNKKLKALTGKETRYFRPPFGSYNDKLIETAEEVGLTVVQWDVDSLDWKDNKTSTIVNRVLSKVRNGSIILFHNNSDFVWEAVGILIPTLKNMGYEFALISELVATQNYTIDHTGRQTINKNDIS